MGENGVRLDFPMVLSKQDQRVLKTDVTIHHRWFQRRGVPKETHDLIRMFWPTGLGNSVEAIPGFRGGICSSEFAPKGWRFEKRMNSSWRSWMLSLVS
jgi:hypothetical protein